MSWGGFLFEVALFVGLFTLIGSPVMAVAYRRGKSRTMTKFLFAGLLTGLFAAILSATSDALVSRCDEAGNTGCLDYGTAGIQTLILVAYGLVSLIATVRLIRD